MFRCRKRVAFFNKESVHVNAGARLQRAGGGTWTLFKRSLQRYLICRSGRCERNMKSCSVAPQRQPIDTSCCTKIAWRVQALAFGDISKQARLRASELESQCTLKGEVLFASPHPPKTKQTKRKREDKRLPPRATVLTRLYRNREIVVTVLKDGFEYEGQHYRSLSAIARMITGTQWNGLVFFGLAKRGEKVDRTKRKPRLEKSRAA